MGKTLNELKAGRTATVKAVGGEGTLRRHLLDMGIIPEAEITLVKFAPMGDPLEVRVHGYELTLRLSDAEHIEIENERDEAPTDFGSVSASESKAFSQKHHPGLGESGRLYHEKSSENPLPDSETLTFALAGNQNSGKTTLFNQLTGSNRHVGNFPGVTVDRIDGVMKRFPNTLVTDLPGIYSMSPYGRDETLTREFILNEKPNGIINIVDAANIERNLYLTMQLIELDTPMVLALNMMDEVRESGGSILVNEMEEYLGIPVVPISAAKNEGIDELVDHLMHVAKYQERPTKQDLCSSDDDGGAIHRCLHGIMHLIEDHAKAAEIPVRFAASKIAEGDSIILEKLDLSENEKEMIEHIIVQMEEERGLDRAAAIASMRFKFIAKVCRASVIKPRESKGHKISVAADRILTGKYTAIPVFIAIMGLVFWLTFSVIGAFLQRLLDRGISALADICGQAMSAAGVNDALYSLVEDGIFTGVGAVVSFLPIIVTLFFFLSILEDSGYMGRVAFVTDKLLRKIGLSGRSIVPMLIGFGCSVPAIMASRTLPSERDRKMTILLTPFMSCSAKLPVYAFLTAAFFPEHAALVMIGLYVLGILVGILTALVMNKTRFKGAPVPFVMELPNYRMPRAKNVGRLLWEKAADFLQRACTVILLAAIVIWFLQNFDVHLNFAAAPESSILAVLAGIIAPLFAPLGFGNWQFVTALITGFISKESVIATLSILFGGISEIAALLTIPAAAALLVFCLLYTPCIAAIASVRRELGNKWAIYVVFMQCAIAWVCALIFHMLLSLFF